MGRNGLRRPMEGGNDTSPNGGPAAKARRGMGDRPRRHSWGRYGRPTRPGVRRRTPRKSEAPRRHELPGLSRGGNVLGDRYPSEVQVQPDNTSPVPANRLQARGADVLAEGDT